MQGDIVAPTATQRYGHGFHRSARATQLTQHRRFRRIVRRGAHKFAYEATRKGTLWVKDFDTKYSACFG